MEEIILNEQETAVRKDERLKSAQKNDDFRLNAAEYTACLKNLKTDDADLLGKTIKLFSQHYKHNSFIETDETRLIIDLAVSIIQQEEISSELQKNSYLFIFNAIKSSVSGFSFILTTGLFDIFLSNISTIESPYFDQTIIALPIILCRDIDISKIFFNKVPIEYFIEIFNNYEADRNPDVPISIIRIMFSFLVLQNETKQFSPENNENLFLLMNFILECLSSSYNQSDSFHFEITQWCIMTLNKFYKQSVIFCQNKIDQVIQIFTEIIEYSIQLQISSSGKNKSKMNNHADIKRNRRLIVTVMNTLISLFESGSVINDSQNIILPIFSIINSNYPVIQIKALHCIDVFLRCYPDRIGFFIQNSILDHFKTIFENGSYCARKESIGIIRLMLKNGENEDQMLILQNNLIEYIISFMKDIDNEFYLVCLDILNMMLVMEDTLSTDFHVHSRFLEHDGLDIISDKTLDDEIHIAEISQQFLQTHFNDKE